MALLQLTPTTLSVRLTRGEKIAGLLRDLTVPLSDVRAVDLVDDAVHSVRGLRAPGLGLPGLRKIGTWRRPGERTYVCVRRDQTAVRIRLEGQRYDTLLIGADDAVHLVGELTARLRAAG